MCCGGVRWGRRNSKITPLCAYVGGRVPLIRVVTAVVTSGWGRSGLGKITTLEEKEREPMEEEEEERGREGGRRSKRRRLLVTEPTRG